MEHSNQDIQQSSAVTVATEERVPNVWIFSKDELFANTPSRNDGITYLQELEMRQKMGEFLSKMIMNLSEKPDNYLLSVSCMYANRFFRFHSFARLDFRDIAAACLFLAGKNEDSPKKLKYVVTQLWHLRNPQNIHFESPKQFEEMCLYVTIMESLVLKTLSFDCSIDLPHSQVLKLMNHLEKGRKNHKELMKTAYFLATDMLVSSDWSIRYTAQEIATACVSTSAHLHQMKFDEFVHPEFADNWYKFQLPSMTLEKLKNMTDEFIEIAEKHPSMINTALKGRTLPGYHPRSPCDVSSSVLPPPPPPPVLQQPKKLDISMYKERQRIAGTPPVQSTEPAAPRQSFMPDVGNRIVVAKSLEERREEDIRRYNSIYNQHHDNIQQPHPPPQPQNHHHHHHHHKQSASSSSSDIKHEHHHHHHHIHHHHRSSSGHHSSSSETHKSHHKHEHGHHHHGHHHSGSDRHAKPVHLDKRRGSDDLQREKRSQMEHINEYQPSEKRPKIEPKDEPNNEYEYTAFVAASTSANSSDQQKLTSYSMTVTSTTNHESASAASTYQKMVMEINQTRPSPNNIVNGTVPLELPRSYLLAPPPPPPVLFFNDDMEDGEVR